MIYGKMKAVLQDYNWDSGLDVSKQILLDENCDLALALEVFCLGGGFEYSQTFTHNIGSTKEWFCFISDLYDDIDNGRYEKSEHHYTVPLSQVQRYQLRKNIPEVFLTDIQIPVQGGQNDHSSKAKK